MEFHPALLPRWRMLRDEDPDDWDWDDEYYDDELELRHGHINSPEEEVYCKEIWC